MPLYVVPMIVVEAHECNYTVEADSEEEALAKAYAGDTVDEEYTTLLGVHDRARNHQEPIERLKGDD